jgi:hypothetical protein
MNFQDVLLRLSTIEERTIKLEKVLAKQIAKLGIQKRKLGKQKSKLGEQASDFETKLAEKDSDFKAKLEEQASDFETKLGEKDSDIQVLGKQASNFEAQLVKVQAQFKSTTSKYVKLQSQVIELSHPLESLVVGGICEEFRQHIHFFETGTRMTKQGRSTYVPKSASWAQLHIPKTEYNALKSETVRNVSSRTVGITCLSRIMWDAFASACRRLHIRLSVRSQ